MRSLAEETGSEPKALKTRPPKLLPDLVWIWEAFCTLSDMRGYGDFGGPQPISMQALLAYVEYRQISRHWMRQRLLDGIALLDAEHLSYVADEAKRRKPMKR